MRSESKWTRVASSAVRAVRYHAAQNELDVRYAGGREYRYGKVPRSKFRALLEANSVGEFVNGEIKPHHPFQEITSNSRRHSRNVEDLPNAD